MPFNDAGGFHVNRILVAEIAVADTFRGAVEAPSSVLFEVDELHGPSLKPPFVVACT